MVLAPIPPTLSQLDGDANALKSKANEEFNKGNYLAAARLYTLAIDLVTDNADPTTIPPATLHHLDTTSAGSLHTLLSNRSLANLKQLDYPAACSDAALSIRASPSFAKGHLRLLAALDAMSAPISERRGVVQEALQCCPNHPELKSKELQYSLDTDATSALPPPTRTDSASVMAATLKIADDVSDPRRGLACGDVGSAYASGAHGLALDLGKAVTYLKVGVSCGDGGSARYLGMVYLEEGKHGEAAGMFSEAVRLGDEEAGGILKSMGEEAAVKRKEAIVKLKIMAEGGDEKARKMLEEMEEQ